MRQDTLVTRRELLAGLGAAASAGLAGCIDREQEPTPETPGPPSPEPNPDRRTATPESVDDEADLEPPESLPYADQYGDLVDVAAAGADPTGEQPIEPVLEEAAGDDTLLYFPEGRYRMSGRWQRPSFDNFAMVGGPATIVPESGYAGYLLLLGWDDGGRTARVENLTFDFRDSSVAARPLQILADDLVVRDVSVVGRQNAGRGMMRFDVTDPDGEGLVERMRLPDGAAVDTGTVGCLVGPASTGEITFRDCRIQGFPNNGLYASPSKGRVVVEGGYYANNGIASVRVSGDSVVRGVHVRCDDSSRPLDNMRGIRLRHGDSILVEDCTVELGEVTYSEGAITMEALLESATVRDTTVRVDADGVPAVAVKSPASQVDSTVGPDGEPNLRLENLDIRGSAASEQAVRVVDRGDCRFEGFCVRQTGDDRDGFHLVRSGGNVLRNALIDVTGQPFVLEQSPLERVDVTVASGAMEGGSANASRQC